MFYTLHINVGGRKHNRFFHEFENVEREYNKEIADRVKSGWTITSNVNRFDVAKGQQYIEVHGKTPDGEDYAICIFDTYFEDESEKEILESNKVYEYLVWRHNIFHADMIHRAVYNENVSVEDFLSGCKKIYESERDGEDEFIPSEFENV